MSTGKMLHSALVRWHKRANCSRLKKRLLVCATEECASKNIRTKALVNKSKTGAELVWPYYMRSLCVQSQLMSCRIVVVAGHIYKDFLSLLLLLPKWFMPIPGTSKQYFRIFWPIIIMAGIHHVFFNLKPLDFN